MPGAGRALVFVVLILGSFVSEATAQVTVRGLEKTSESFSNGYLLGAAEVLAQIFFECGEVRGVAAVAQYRPLAKLPENRDEDAGVVILRAMSEPGCRATGRFVPDAK